MNKIIFLCLIWAFIVICIVFVDLLSNIVAKSKYKFVYLLIWCAFIVLSAFLIIPSLGINKEIVHIFKIIAIIAVILFPVGMLLDESKFK